MFKSDCGSSPQTHTEKATWKLIVVYLVLENERKIQCEAAHRIIKRPLLELQE